ncbi:MAG TPA: M56 family metallopeptidase [Gemmatimonadales bacterium]|jgi:beta-lactamase regulating signal transducer with metallopeptidase domain/HEAT repeat protein|nr:M56 family metallopeptidase [Gemmatimonadales bacterium]
MSVLLLVLKATALLAAALGVTLVMQRAAAGTRHLIWLVALGALFVLPPLAAWSPLQVRMLPQTLATAATASQTGAIPDASRTPARTSTTADNGTWTPAGPAGQGSESLARHAFDIVSSWSGTQRLLALWALVAAGLLLWLLRGVWQVRTIVRRATPLTDPAWQGPLYEIADRLGLEQAPRLLRSDDIHMPFACGLLQSTIVLPVESEAWSAERRSAVLIHELGHVRRRDLLGHTAGRLACALYWFHPLVWTAARKLRDESERACDDLALVFGARPSDYAEHLLDIVTATRDHATPSIALAMAHRKEFEGRMLAILDPALRRVAPTPRRTAAIVASLAAVAVAVSAAAPVARSTQLPAPAPAQAPAPLASAPTTPLAPILPPRTSASTDGTSPYPLAHSASDIADRASEPVRTAADSVHRVALLSDMLAHDNNGDVRRTAAWGLHQFDASPAATSALITALAHDADSDVREMAAWALESVDDAASNNALAHAARSDASAPVRETALWALGSHGTASAVPAMEAALTDDADADVRGTAAWALGQLDLKHVPRAVLSALTDVNADVRLKAAWAALQIGDSAALPALRGALHKETSADNQKAMMRALLSSGEDPEKMVEWLRSPDAELRQMAARALAGGEASSPWPWPWPRPRPLPE